MCRFVYLDHVKMHKHAKSDQHNVQVFSLNDHDRPNCCSAKPLSSKKGACQWLDIVDLHMYAKFDLKNHDINFH